MKATVKKPGKLLDFLLEMMQTSKKTTARQLLKFNGVKLDGNLEKRANRDIQPGQVVEINRVEKPVGDSLGPGGRGVRLLYEDEAILVARKPAGLLSIGTDLEKNKTMHALLFGYVQANEGGRVYAVHRLDRPVGGVMVFAKTSEAKTDLQLNWKDAQKRYVALVAGKPPRPAGRIENWLEEISPQKVVVTDESPRAKFSITEYSTRGMKGDHSLLDINLLTGRRHQIRVHMAHLGCPIVGDRVYGTGIQGSNEIMLFAYSLSFRHPITGKNVTFKADLPKWAARPKKNAARRSGPRTSRG